jgi:hypothetical protein
VFCLAYTAAVIVDCPLARADASANGGLSDIQVKVLEKLASQKYFKDASCAQFTNLILSNNHLPLIGQISPAPTLRGDIDRRGENERLPELKDGATLKTHPRFEVAVETVADGQQLWSLKLTRRLDATKAQDSKLPTPTHLDTETTYFFSVGMKNNQPFCDLQRISYIARPKLPAATVAAQGLASLSQQYATPQCIDLFLDQAPALKDKPLGSLELYFIKKDCAVGVHFFSDAKEILSKRRLGLRH